MFAIRNGVLYRRWWQKDRSEERYLLAVPKCFRTEILRAIHDTPEGGHIGQRATLRKLQERFWWPKMQSNVRSYVASCEACQQFKRLPGCQPGLLTPVEIPEDIFHTVGIDYIGPLPTSTAENRYIIVAVDYLSKYVEATAVPSLAYTHLVDFLQHRFEWRHGLPKKLISDRATTFRSRGLRKYLSTAGVQHHYTSAFHPQANGLTERTNQSIQARLAPYTKVGQKGEADWDVHLPAAVYAVNTALQTSTGVTPYEIVYGKLPQLKAVLRLDAPVSVARSDSRTVSCQKIRAAAKEKATQAQEKQKRYYDRRRRPAPAYNIGDEVWVQRGGNCTGKKLLAKFEGPFTITERVGENTWRVRTSDPSFELDRRKRNNFAVHVSRLKKRLRRLA